MTLIRSPMLLYALSFLGLVGLVLPIALGGDLGIAVASNATLAAGLVLVNRYLSLPATSDLTSRLRTLRTLKVMAVGTAFFVALATIVAVRYGPVELARLHALAWWLQLAGSAIVWGSSLISEQIAMRLSKQPFGLLNWMRHESKWSKKGMQA